MSKHLLALLAVGVLVHKPVAYSLSFSASSSTPDPYAIRKARKINQRNKEQKRKRR